MTPAVEMTDDHVYTWHGDPPIIGADSVTRIISGGVPKFLTAWAAKLAAECAVHKQSEWAHLPDDEAIAHIKKASDRVRDRSADIGTRAHKWCEDRVAGTHGEPDPDIKGHAAQFERFLADWQPRYLETEVAVFSRTHRYAGTLDGIAELGPSRSVTLLDVKTGKSVYPEVALQLAAYARADFIGRDDGTEDPLPEIDQFAVLHLRPNGYKLVPVTVGDDEWFSFLYAQQVRAFLSRGRQLIGAPLTIPGVAA